MPSLAVWSMRELYPSKIVYLNLQKICLLKSDNFRCSWSGKQETMYSIRTGRCAYEGVRNVSFRKLLLTSQMDNAMMLLENYT